MARVLWLTGVHMYQWNRGFDSGTMMRRDPDAYTSVCIEGTHEPFTGSLSLASAGRCNGAWSRQYTKVHVVRSPQDRLEHPYV